MRVQTNSHCRSTHGIGAKNKRAGRCRPKNFVSALNLGRPPTLCCVWVYPIATSTSDTNTAVLGLTLELNDALLAGFTTKSDKGGFE
jgi:hypothetical protein